MNFVLYFLLRRFFVRLRFSDTDIFLEKGLLLRRKTVIPLSAVTKIRRKQTLLLRVFRAAEVTVYTLSGKSVFYLRRTERLPFLPENRGIPLHPERKAVLLGVVSDTRAITGTVFFSIMLWRIGSTFGDEYNQKIISAIVGTAEELSHTLEQHRIAVPHIAAVGFVFVLAAWLFALLRRFVMLGSFTAARRGGFLTVRHGLITLYEQVLVLNNLNAAVFVDSAVTLAAGAAPLYGRDVMLFPPVKHEQRQRLCRTLCALNEENCVRLSPRKSALLSHCIVPLGWFAGLSAASLFIRLLKPFANQGVPLLTILLWAGELFSLWSAIKYGVYMFRSFICAGESTLCISARKGGRLYTALIPRSMAVSAAIHQNPFQLRRNRCDISLHTVGGRRFRLRHIDFTGNARSIIKFPLK